MMMWNFSQPSNWSVSITPKFEDFFLDTDSTAADNLVREVTQNAGDASVKPEGEVTVSFRFGEMSVQRFSQRYMRGLEPHLFACDNNKAAAILKEQTPVGFLIIEDFGTTGLKGSIERDADESNYNRFWWRYGDSGKQGEEGGRHGVGKTTISSSSRLRFFFGLTVIKQEPRALLLVH